MASQENAPPLLGRWAAVSRPVGLAGEGLGAWSVTRLRGGAAALSQPLFAPTAGAASLPSARNAFSTLHGLYWLLNNSPTRSCALALLADDLHWCDAESLRFLAACGLVASACRLTYVARAVDVDREPLVGGQHRCRPSP